MSTPHMSRRQTSPVARFVDSINAEGAERNKRTPAHHAGPSPSVTPFPLSPAATAMAASSSATKSAMLPSPSASASPRVAAASPASSTTRRRRGAPATEAASPSRTTGRTATTGKGPSAAPLKADMRLEGWSIISKITPFVHAVGRVGDGRGSAILVALPERTDKERAVAWGNAQALSSHRRRRRRGRTTRGTTASPQRSTPLPHNCTPLDAATFSRAASQCCRTASSHMRNSWSPGTSVAWGPSQGSDMDTDDPSDAAQEQEQGLTSSYTETPLAVLLTTTAVLGSREEASGATITFLEQPVAGTAAQLGREPVPFSVAVRGDVGFVSSVAPPSSLPKKDRRSSTSATLWRPSRAADDAAPVGLDLHSPGSPHSLTRGNPSRRKGLNSSRTPSPIRAGSGRRSESSPQETFHWGGAEAGNRSYQGQSNRQAFGAARTGSAQARQASLDSVGRYSDGPLHTTSDEDEKDGDAVEEIGYVLTYCELEPRATLREDPYRSSNASTGLAGTPARFSMSTRATSTASFGAPTGYRGGPRTQDTESTFSGPGHTSSDTATGPLLPDGPRGRLGGRMSSSAVAENISTVSPKQQKMDSVFLVKPLPLPLLLSAIQPVKVGDTHLMVTHVDGRKRHYVVQYVAAVHTDFCEYEDDPLLVGDYSSGGPVFDMNGDFIGLQHRLGNQSICMFSSSIVKNLFEANKLGMCRTPISSQPLPDDGTFGERVVTTTERVPEEMFNQPLSFTQQSSAMDVGVEGDRLINYEDLERLREYRERPIPLTERNPSYSEVYKEFYKGFDSLTHMLNAFYYCPALTAKVLETMVSVPYRQELQTVASSGGVGMVLEVMDGYPDVASLVITSLSALSRMCLHRHNLAAFVLLDGVATVLEILKEYPHSPQILQWGAYCLAHVTTRGAPAVEQTVDILLRCNFVELAAAALRAHGKAQDHLSRWFCVALANVAELEPRSVALYVQEELPSVVLGLVQHFSCDAATLARLLSLLSRMLQPLCDALPDDMATHEAQQGYEALRPFACVSPLSVSAYFLYITLASQPEFPMDAEERAKQAALRDADGRCACPWCPRCAASPPETATPIPAAPASRPSAAKAAPPSPSDLEGRKDKAVPEKSPEAAPLCHNHFVVPRTALNRILMAMLDRESRERRNGASEELLTVCLDVLVVLDSWGLFPVHYTSQSSLDASGGTAGYGSDAASRWGGDFLPVTATTSAASTHSRRGLSTYLGRHQTPSTHPILATPLTNPMMNESATGTERSRESEFVTYGFAMSTVQEVLERVAVNYAASHELAARVEQFSCLNYKDDGEARVE